MRPTNFVLTQEQETELLTFIEQRVDSLRSNNAERIQADAESWRRFKNDAKARAKDKSIYELSNIHAPITAMIAEYFAARAEDDIAGEAPFFHFDAVGASDTPQATDFNAYFNWKLDTKAKTHVVLKQAIVPCFVQRATILKAAHAVEPKRWIDRDRRILHDLATGKPVVIPNHGPVIEGEDEWELRPDPVEPAPAMPASPQAVAPGPVMPEGPQEAMPGELPPSTPMRMHLKDDPTLIFDPTKYEWKLPPGGLKREEILYRGGKTGIVPSGRFLCPMDAASIEDADTVAEEYDKDLSWIQGMWLERPWAKWAENQAAFSQGDASPKTKPTDEPDSKAEKLEFDTLSPKRKILEVWVRRNVLKWEEGPQEFVVFVDAETKKAIYYEFVAKVCPDFKRPYTVISPLNTEPGRWCADQSLVENILQYQDAYDRQFNAGLYRNWQNSNPIKCHNPAATIEEEEDLEFDPLKVYTLKNGKHIDDFFQTKALPDLDTQTKDWGDAILYLLQLWLGVSNLAQGDYSNIPQNNTATGVQATLQEASKLSRRFNRRIIDGFEENLLKLVQITASTFPENAQETFEFFEGQDRITGTVTQADIRKLEINVKLVVSARYNQQQAEAAMKALEVQDAYFAAVATPLVMQAKRPLFVQILVSLGFRNADELLPAPATLGIMIPMPGQAPAGDPAAAPGQPAAIAA